MAYQDFTTFTKVGTSTVSANTILSNAMSAFHDSRVYKDMGVGGIGTSFTHTVVVRAVSSYRYNDQSLDCAIWGISDSTGTNPNTNCVSLNASLSSGGTFWSLSIADNSGATAASFTINAATSYYLRIIRNSYNLTVKVYSDALMTVLVRTLSTSTFTSLTKRYLFGLGNHNYGAGDVRNTMTVQVQNLDLNPPAQTIAESVSCSLGVIAPAVRTSPYEDFRTGGWVNTGVTVDSTTGRRWKSLEGVGATRGLNKIIQFNDYSVEFSATSPNTHFTEYGESGYVIFGLFGVGGQTPIVSIHHSYPGNGQTRYHALYVDNRKVYEGTIDSGIIGGTFRIVKNKTTRQVYWNGNLIDSIAVADTVFNSVQVGTASYPTGGFEPLLPPAYVYAEGYNYRLSLTKGRQPNPDIEWIDPVTVIYPPKIIITAQNNRRVNPLRFVQSGSVNNQLTTAQRFWLTDNSIEVIDGKTGPYRHYALQYGQCSPGEWRFHWRFPTISAWVNDWYLIPFSFNTPDQSKYARILFQYYQGQKQLLIQYFYNTSGGGSTWRYSSVPSDLYVSVILSATYQITFNVYTDAARTTLWVSKSVQLPYGSDYPWLFWWDEGNVTSTTPMTYSTKIDDMYMVNGPVMSMPVHGCFPTVVYPYIESKRVTVYPSTLSRAVSIYAPTVNRISPVSSPVVRYAITKRVTKTSTLRTITSTTYPVKVTITKNLSTRSVATSVLPPIRVVGPCLNVITLPYAVSNKRVTSKPALVGLPLSYIGANAQRVTAKPTVKNCTLTVNPVTFSYSNTVYISGSLAVITRQYGPLVKVNETITFTDVIKSVAWSVPSGLKVFITKRLVSPLGMVLTGVSPSKRVSALPMLVSRPFTVYGVYNAVRPNPSTVVCPVVEPSSVPLVVVRPVPLNVVGWVMTVESIKPSTVSKPIVLYAPSVLVISNQVPLVSKVDWYQSRHVLTRGVACLTRAVVSYQGQPVVIGTPNCVDVSVSVLPHSVLIVAKPSVVSSQVVSVLTPSLVINTPNLLVFTCRSYAPSLNRDCTVLVGTREASVSLFSPRVLVSVSRSHVVVQVIGESHLPIITCKPNTVSRGMTLYGSVRSITVTVSLLSARLSVFDLPSVVSTQELGVGVFPVSVVISATPGMLSVVLAHEGRAVIGVNAGLLSIPVVGEMTVEMITVHTVVRTIGGVVPDLPGVVSTQFITTSILVPAVVITSLPVLSESVVVVDSHVPCVINKPNDLPVFVDVNYKLLTVHVPLLTLATSVGSVSSMVSVSRSNVQLGVVSIGVGVRVSAKPNVRISLVRSYVPVVDVRGRTVSPVTPLGLVTSFNDFLKEVEAQPFPIPSPVVPWGTMGVDNVGTGQSKFVQWELGLLNRILSEGAFSVHLLFPDTDIVGLVKFLFEGEVLAALLFELSEHAEFEYLRRDEDLLLYFLWS